MTRVPYFAATAVCRQRGLLIFTELPLLGPCDQGFQGLFHDMAQAILRIHVVITRIEVSRVFERHRVSAGGTKKAETLGYTHHRLQSYLKELDEDLSHIATHPMVEDGAEKFSPLFRQNGALTDRSLPRTHCSQETVLIGLGGESLNQGDKLVESATDGLEKFVNLKGVVGIVTMHHRQGVVLHLMALEDLQASHDLIESGLAGLVRAIEIVEMSRPVDGQAYQEFVFGQKLAPFRIEQDSIGLDGVGHRTTLSVLRLEFHHFAKIVHSQNGGLTALPSEGCLLRMSGHHLLDITLQKLIGHLGAFRRGAVEFLFFEIEAITAIQVAECAAGFRHDMKGHGTTIGEISKLGLPRAIQTGLLASSRNAPGMDPNSLIEELVKQGLVSREVIHDLAGSERHRGKAIERALIDEGVVEETRILQIMAELYHLPYIVLSPDLLDSTLASELPHRMLENYCVYPLQREQGSEVVPLATVDPLDVNAADVFKQITGREISYVLAAKSQIEQAIEGKLLGSEGFRLLVDMVPDPSEWRGLESMLEAEVNELSENATPIIKLVDSILRDAYRLKASDIHIEPQEKNFRVRYRIDGLLKTIVELPKRAEKTCTSRLKIMAGLDISETRKPQDGRISLKFSPEEKLNLRVSTVASHYGEKIVLRLLDQSAVELSLSQLGLSSESLGVLQSHIKSSYGMILITGPTGSGKTSTLYACLHLLNDPSVNIVTVEDPIEYQIEGLTQVQINLRAGQTFATTLRSFLRQDPDIIMVGEMRDQLTAETAIQAAQSGHLVLSTLHTNDAPSTLSRLILMGIEPHQVAGSLLCVMAQRLVRKMCPHCKAPTQLNEEQRTLLSLSLEGIFPKHLYHGTGCEKCEGTGHKGRLGLYEILTVTSSLRQQILIDSTENALWQTARKEGMITLLEDGIAKVEAGLTTLEEVLRVVTIKRRSDNPESPLRTDFPIVASPSFRPGTVEEVMTKHVFTVHPNDSLYEVAKLLLHHGVSGCPVVDDLQEVVGMVTYVDLASSRWGEQRPKESATAADAMTAQVIAVSPSETLAKAAHKMWRHRVHRLVVLKEEKLVGILTPFDLMLQSNLFR